VLAPSSGSLFVGAVGQGGDVVMGVFDFEVERVMRWIPSRQRRNENNEFADQFGRKATLRISGHNNYDGSLAISCVEFQRNSLTTSRYAGAGRFPGEV
jgi:hypothetical protein